MNSPIRVYVVDLSTSSRKRPFLYLQWTDPVTGKRHTETSKCKTRRDAEQAAAARESQLNAPTAPSDGTIPWNDVEGKTLIECRAGFKTLHSEQVLSGVAVKTEQKVLGIFNALEEYASEHDLRLTELRHLSSQFLSGFVAWRRSLKKSESTIRSDLRHLHAVLQWAVDQHYIAAIPTIPATPRASKQKLMKGRELSAEEFDKFLKQIPKIVDAGQASNWTRMANGLWLSGLRLGEAMQLSWDTNTPFHVMMSARPKLRIPADGEKGHEDRIYPVTPDFASWLDATPKGERHGPVFMPTYLNHRNGKVERFKNASDVSRVFSQIGESAEIVVNAAKRTQKAKFASAHDLRRSFGARWSRLVPPFVLKELMRHATIQTTEAYYVGENANATQDVVWAAWERFGGGNAK